MHLILSCLTAILLLTNQATATQHVLLGDSLSAHPDSWAHQLLDPDFTNLAHGGQQAFGYLNGCNPNCWWLNGVEPQQTWWIMLGTNDLAQGETPQQTVESIHEIVLRIILTGVSDVRLVHSPNAHSIWGASRMQLNIMIDEMALLEKELCNDIPTLNCVADLRGFPRSDYLWDGIHFNEAGNLHAFNLVSLTIPEPATSSMLYAGVIFLSMLEHRRKASS